MEMISPVAEGRAAELLLSAHATEILARAMLALQGNEKVGLVSDQKRLRLQAVGDLIKSDLRHPWTIAELARHAGLGRRIVQRAVSPDVRRQRIRLPAEEPACRRPRSLAVSGIVGHRGGIFRRLRQFSEFFHGVPQAFRICAEPLPSRQTILTCPKADPLPQNVRAAAGNERSAPTWKASTRDQRVFAQAQRHLKIKSVLSTMGTI